MTEPILFLGTDGDPRDLNEVVGRAIGAAASCWESLHGTGRYQVDRALTIHDEAVSWIEAHYELKPEFRDGATTTGVPLG